MITENKIQEATEKIAECKVELQEAKRIRKNRQGTFGLTFLLFFSSFFTVVDNYEYNA